MSMEHPSQRHIHDTNRLPNDRSGGQCVSRRSSGASATSVVSIERLKTGAERRRSSNISFEKHDMLVMAEIAALIDDENDDDNDSCSLGNLAGTSTADESSGRDVSSSDTQASFHQSFGRTDRRTSEVSVDLDDVAEACLAFSTADPQETSSRSSMSVLSRLQDEIIEKEIWAGKLQVEEMGEEEHHATLSSSQSSIGHGSSFARRGSSSSFGRRGSAGSAGRRVSFSRGSLTGRGSFRSSASPMQQDISTALAELHFADDHGYMNEDKDEVNEEEEEEAIARAVSAAGGLVARGSITGRDSITLEVEVAQPPPQGAAPRRSSLKRPEDRRHWS